MNKYSEKFNKKSNLSSAGEKVSYSAYFEGKDFYKKENQKKLPRLSLGFEKALESNFRELSIIESGLIKELERPKILYCTSSFPKEGKTVASIATAFGVSRYSKRKVLLIDSCFKDPQVHKFFGITNSPGLQEALSKKVKLEDAITPTYYDQLYILSAGEGDRPLIDPYFKELLSVFSKNFAYTIIDGWPVLVDPDPINMASLVDGFILVVECESTKWDVAQISAGKITNAGGKVVGVVLNKRKFYIPEVIYRRL